MSDTPRTDNCQISGPSFLGWVSADFARTLERELTEANEACIRAMKLYEMTLANEMRWMRLHTEVTDALATAIKERDEAKARIGTADDCQAQREAYDRLCAERDSLRAIAYFRTKGIELP